MSETEGGLIWLERTDLDQLAPGGERPIALVCDLDAPHWRAFQELAPTSDDLADQGRPAAGHRSYFLRRRSLLRHLLARWRGGRPEQARIAYDAHGAPRALGPGSEFVSVASRGSLAAFALASTPAGVDLEPDRPFQSPVESILTDGERARLGALSDERERSDAFLRLWTMKEAYLKAIGTGLLRDPARVDVRACGADRAEIHDGAVLAPARAAEWRRRGTLGLVCACFVAAPSA